MGHFQCLSAQSLNENLLSLLFQRNYLKRDFFCLLQGGIATTKYFTMQKLITQPNKYFDHRTNRILKTKIRSENYILIKKKHQYPAYPDRLTPLPSPGESESRCKYFKKNTSG